MVERCTVELKIEKYKKKGYQRTLFLIKKKQRKGKKFDIFNKELARPMLISLNKLRHLQKELKDKEITKEKEEEKKELRR